MPFGITVKDIIIFLGGVVASAIISAFFYNMGKKKKYLEYKISSTKLIKETVSTISGLTIKMYDKPISNLTSTTIKFCNSGNQTIQSSDFAKQQPLEIHIDGTLFNEGSLSDIDSNNQNLCPILNFTGSEIVIDFDYLDPDQYFLVNILHDGSLSVSGAIKGGKMGEYYLNTRKDDAIIRVSFVIVATVLFSIAVSPYFFDNITIPSIVQWILYFYAFCFGFCGLFSPSTFSVSVRRIYKIVYERKLDDF